MCSSQEAGQSVIAILAGGLSRRMGRDKALLKVGEESILERTARLALATSARVVIIGRPCPNNWPYEDVRFVPDDQPALGPLGGLATALRTTTSDIFLLPCDLPLLTLSALRWLTQAALNWHDYDGVVCRNEGRIEPLFAWYRYQTLSLVEQQLARGEYALRKFIELADIGFVDLPVEHRVVTTNANSPEDWKESMSKKRWL